MEQLFWVLLIGAAVIWCIVIGAAIYAQKASVPDREQQARHFIVWGGAVFPTVVVGALLVWGLVILKDITPNEGDRTIHVDGERWWWRVVYDTEDGPVPTANEIRIPLGETALFKLTADDVIHSFWVPSLGGKMDMIPGRETQLALTPQKLGNWGGLCAEYCGGAHALMRFDTVVMEPEEFDAWLAAQARPANVDPEDEGYQVFTEEGCGSCHTIRGTDSIGPVGPDLTHFASRERLGAGIYKMTPENVSDWITDLDNMKPDIDMPSYPHINGARLEALVSFLMSLE